MIQPGRLCTEYGLHCLTRSKGRCIVQNRSAMKMSSFVEGHASKSCVLDLIGILESLHCQSAARNCNSMFSECQILQAPGFPNEVAVFGPRDPAGNMRNKPGRFKPTCPWTEKVHFHDDELPRRKRDLRRNVGWNAVKVRRSNCVVEGPQHWQRRDSSWRCFCGYFTTSRCKSSKSMVPPRC